MRASISIFQASAEGWSSAFDPHFGYRLCRFNTEVPATMLVSIIEILPKLFSDARWRLREPTRRLECPPCRGKGAILGFPKARALGNQARSACIGLPSVPRIATDPCCLPSSGCHIGQALFQSPKICISKRCLHLSIALCT